MIYLLTFFEGIVTFISPCFLPVLPIYLIYFSGDKKNKKFALLNSIFFVLGFTLMFICFGIFASTIGNLFNTKYLNILISIFFIIIGINFMDIINIPFFNNLKGFSFKTQKISITKSFFLGITFSYAWSPCVGQFLSIALATASRNNKLQAALLLLCYSLGLGLPIIISSLIINELSNVFNIIKNNYHIINKLSGFIFIVLGIISLIKIYI